jgi:membrane protease YdiL (CAAX protease family)
MLSGFIGIVFYQLMLLVVVSILALVCMKKTKENFYRIAIVVICFVFYFLMRVMPSILNFRNFEMPWESRLFSIIAGIICILLFGKYFTKNNYFKIRQENKDLRITILLSILTIIGYLVIFYFSGSFLVFNMEELLFLSTVVGIEEEMFFRGILLGLLMSCLDEKILFIKYSAVVLSAIYFGLWHGNFTNFDYIHIIINCCYGYIVGWITIKNKSIIIPLIMHILINFLGYLLMLIKI